MATQTPCPQLFLFLVTSVLLCGCYQDVDLSNFSRALADLANHTLGAEKMQEHFANLPYTEAKKNVSAEQLARQISRLFSTQQSALRTIKERVEQVYRNGIFTPRDDLTECCDVVNLTDNYEFGLPVSEEQSCDRISGIASKRAHSIYGKLDSTYEANRKIPLKWQYFGSEKGVVNQFPSSKATDCFSYDHRFRPWYKASATPNPKDVVIVIKNNLFPHTSMLFEAADIILRTLNPRDRVAMVMYNRKILKNVIGGCYATNFSLATPANVKLFQSFLNTAPDPKSGNSMSLALEAAFSYFVGDINSNGGTNATERDRAIVFLTDGQRVDEKEQNQSKDVIRKYCQKLRHVSLFILVAYSNDVLIPSDVRIFLEEVVVETAEGTTENLIQINPGGDLRHSITKFYTLFASKAQHSSVFKPVFMVPYYDVFGLEQLVMTLSTPCYSDAKELLGVAAVDLTVTDMFAGAEHFTHGALSYAFVIDQDGLVLLHPLLPFPSSTNAAVYLDISTLEPYPQFERIRQSMISGESGCVELDRMAVLSRGSTEYQGSQTLNVTSNYCWEPIADTPFSLCVVVPKDAYSCQYSKGSLGPPISAYYHRLDILAEKRELCRHMSQFATTDYSTVVLYPEAFEQYSRRVGTELIRETEYIQKALIDLHDSNQLLKRGVLDAVAATAKAEELWLSSSTSSDSVVWRYIASNVGVLRIYPGTQLDTTGIKISHCPWYQSAVANIGSLSISPPHKDHLGTGDTITLSKAIVKFCHYNHSYGPLCSITAVMGLDITYAYFMVLLQSNVEICSQPDKYRCMVIDSNAYVVTHPKFLTESHSIIDRHLSSLEPFLMRDMYKMGYVKRVYCNNFQYNDKFTKRPRRQYSYEVTEKVKNATEPLAGYLTRCVFYKIAPVEGTNTYFIAVDLKRSSEPLCSPVTCSCNPCQPCSNLPRDCTCPCAEEISPENYNSCLESFTGLSAPPCPARAGFLNRSRSIPLMTTNGSVPICFEQQCSEKSSSLECLSAISCDLCHYPLDNGSTVFQCRKCGTCSSHVEEMLQGTCLTENQTDILLWQSMSGVLLTLLVATLLLVLFCCCFSDKLRKKSNGKGATECVNPISSTSEELASVSDLVKERESSDSKEHSHSSQEMLPDRKTNHTMTTVISMVQPLEDGEEGGGEDGKGEDRREGNAERDDPSAGRLTVGSLPDSLAPNGLQDMSSKFGQSPDPSKAGGIWF